MGYFDKTFRNKILLPTNRFSKTNRNIRKNMSNKLIING